MVLKIYVSYLAKRGQRALVGVNHLQGGEYAVEMKVVVVTPIPFFW